MTIQKNLYNLLMSGNETAWTGTSWVMEYDRVFEYTNAQVKQQFEALDDTALAALLDLPTLFAYEKYVGAPVHVGRVTGISRRQKEFAFTFNFDAAVAPIPHASFMQLLAELDIDPKWEVNRSHWAVKNVNLADVLHRAGLLPTGTLGPLRRPPQVFISYSWDSPEHRSWVTQLAMTLRQNGVEVTLDQWHVRPGEDLAHFMARGLRESDRVLMICTESHHADPHSSPRPRRGLDYSLLEPFSHVPALPARLQNRLQEWNAPDRPSRLQKRSVGCVQGSEQMP